MGSARDLAARFDAYGEWRRELAQAVSALHDWLAERRLSDAQIDLQVQKLLGRLHQDKLVVAVVAEFSRGKSELINAIFFADLGCRLLPASAGRTTMCPTELLHDPTQPPAIRLLPIETRLRDATVADFKSYADEWTSLPLDLSSPVAMSEAVARLSEVKRVAPPLARALGLLEDADAPRARGDGAGEGVDVPRWRHAIINFPHPLLQRGLVILDTPGLNAIGAEPELTLSLLPSAHAVLFVLSADTGVTRTDLEVWNRHLGGADPSQRARRIVILNKIDGLWDELRDEREVAAEIDRQVAASAAQLALPPAQIYPVSAQKGLIAKVNGDDELLARSRLGELEEALAGKLISAKHRIVGAATQREARALADGVRALLEARQVNIAEQLAELRMLRGKNQDVVRHMMERIDQEGAVFERGHQRFAALRNVFTQHTNALLDLIGLEALRANAGRTRTAIEKSPFTKGIRNAMGEFFATIRRDFQVAEGRCGEIHDMMHAMYTRFSAEQGIERFTPPPFSMLKYQKEIDRLESAYDRHFNTLWNMLSKAKHSLTRRFFETVATRVKHVYDVANRDVENWLRAVMSPLETQVREHQLQLERRLESVHRIRSASSEIDVRIEELEGQDDALNAEVSSLMAAVGAIDAIVDRPDVLPAAANA